MLMAVSSLVPPTPRFLNAWDAACMALDDQCKFVSSPWQWATMIDDEKQVLVAA
jgi:1,4-alpha-glucan branching enzyme